MLTGLASTYSRRDAVLAARAALEVTGVEGAALDARLLVRLGLGLGPLALAAEYHEAIGEVGALAIGDLLARRLAGVPVARLVGAKEFWGLDFRLSPATLLPRPDTETLVEEALRRCAQRDAPLRVLDLGTGSGCILAAILTERPQAWGLGIDRSVEAAVTARLNAVRLGIGHRAAILVGDWAGALGAAAFDLVVSNPPYIEAGIIPGLAREVREHDPRLALDGGEDGLDAYRAITAALPGLLRPGGHALLEVGGGRRAWSGGCSPRAASSSTRPPATSPGASASSAAGSRRGRDGLPSSLPHMPAHERGVHIPATSIVKSWDKCDEHLAWRLQAPIVWSHDARSRMISASRATAVARYSGGHGLERGSSPVCDGRRQERFGSADTGHDRANDAALAAALVLDARCMVGMTLAGVR